MDYTKIPRALIYKDRTNLNDFGVQTPGTFNNYLFTQMRRMTLLRCGDAKEIALRCFNNAYYICTLMQLEEFPDLCMDKYESLLFQEKISFPEDVYQASMALVCVLLAAYDDKYKHKDNPVIESIYDWTLSNKWVGSLCHKSFEDIIEKCSPDGFSLAPDTFALRDIIEVVENEDISVLALGANYICEKLDLLKDQSIINHEFDLVNFRLSKRLRELYDEYDYDDKTGIFGIDITINEYDSFNKEQTVIKDAMAILVRHYQFCPQTDSKVFESMLNSIPTNLSDNNFSFSKEVSPIDTKGDTETLQAKISQLTSENTSLKGQLNQIKNDMESLKNKMKDYEERFDPIDIQKKKVISMTGKQHVILFLAVLAHHNRIPNARTNLSFLMSFIASRNESTMKDYLKSHITEEECKALAKNFDGVTPFIANLIRELPEKLEKDKSEKNRKKASKKDEE